MCRAGTGRGLGSLRCIEPRGCRTRRSTSIFLPSFAAAALFLIAWSLRSEDSLFSLVVVGDLVLPLTGRLTRSTGQLLPGNSHTAPKRSTRSVSWCVRVAKRFDLFLDEAGRFDAFLPFEVTVAIVWPESDLFWAPSSTGSLEDPEV